MMDIGKFQWNPKCSAKNQLKWGSRNYSFFVGLGHMSQDLKPSHTKHRSYGDTRNAILKMKLIILISFDSESILVYIVIEVVRS